ncbi:hypothetical protein Mtc_2024 [Methanocella conradii HZ254]|uniref:Uncharacterized protein n=1 Tax=Methanocella conradii (strain DSM 24694 / JCM 17849 / CGMCC 1.5162 / HZ254) TaxID=1041930 RepID=H8I798_METCZ|nr:hypothetical protein [Methanocella conradii]AFD00764.1 hypothetical protein Mtc_2024 [Methanocella conradii HZ254]MDI6897957.1 hypothetical protein [Methanocella conradii]
MSDGIEEIVVPCPCCGKLHRVKAKEIRENKFVKVDCGATLGSVGLLRRLEEAEKRAVERRGRLYKL